MSVAQPTSALADELDALVPELDELIADARLGTPFGRADWRLAELEERAQKIASELIGIFRGKGTRPVVQLLRDRPLRGSAFL